MKNITLYDEKIIKILKRNNMKPNSIYASVTHVSRSGMTRYIKVFTKVNRELNDITETIANILGWSFDYRKGLKVQGCGMDMCFHTLCTTYDSIMKRKGGHKCHAAQHYRTL